MNGWEAKTPQPKSSRAAASERRSLNLNFPSRMTTILSSTRMLKIDDEDTVDTADDDDVDAPASDPTLPPLYAHGDADSAAAKELVDQASHSSSGTRFAFRTMGCRQDIYRRLIWRPPW